MRGASEAGILAIDGANVGSASWSLLPGPHEILVRFRIHTVAPDMNYDYWTYCLIALEAAAGEDYTSVVRVSKEVASPSISDKDRVEIGLADASGKLRVEPRWWMPKRPKLAKKPS